MVRFSNLKLFVLNHETFAYGQNILDTQNEQNLLKMDLENVINKNIITFSKLRTGAGLAFFTILTDKISWTLSTSSLI